MHYGSGMPVFRGEFRQRGYGLSNLLASMARTVLPVLQPVLKSFAKSALKTGGKVAADVLSGRDTLKSSARKRIASEIESRVSKRKRNDIFQ